MWSHQPAPPQEEAQIDDSLILASGEERVSGTVETNCNDCMRWIWGQGHYYFRGTCHPLWRRAGLISDLRLDEGNWACRVKSIKFKHPPDSNLSIPRHVPGTYSTWWLRQCIVWPDAIKITWWRVMLAHWLRHWLKFYKTWRCKCAIDSGKYQCDVCYQFYYCAVMTNVVEGVKRGLTRSRVLASLVAMGCTDEHEMKRGVRGGKHHNQNWFQVRTTRPHKRGIRT